METYGWTYVSARINRPPIYERTHTQVCPYKKRATTVGCPYLVAAGECRGEYQDDHSEEQVEPAHPGRQLDHQQIGAGREQPIAGLRPGCARADDKVVGHAHRHQDGDQPDRKSVV